MPFIYHIMGLKNDVPNHTMNQHEDKLVTLNHVYHNTLIQNKIHPLIEKEPPIITTPLYPHQLLLVNGMHAYKDKMTRGFFYQNEIMNGKIGIVGDPAGSGKTLSMLTYLATAPLMVHPKTTYELTTDSSKYFFSQKQVVLEEQHAANLVIVPHSLFSQWQKEIQTHTQIPYVAIETRRYLKGDELADKIKRSTFLLTTNKCYKAVQHYATQYGIQWNNVIIDEAASIYMNSSDPPLLFQFLWLVSNQWIPLLFKAPTIQKSSLFFMKDRILIHPEFEAWLLDDITTHYEATLTSYPFLKEYLPITHPHRHLLILRNTSEFLQHSIPIIPVHHQIVDCRPHITMNSLMSYYLSRNREPEIPSDKVSHLFQSLHILFQSVEQYMEGVPVKRVEMIRKKITENECIICFGKCDYPTIVNCCYFTYCGRCLLKNTLLTHKCPTCRESLSISNMCCLESSVYPPIRSKLESCIEMFRQNDEGQFIIYSAFENIYYELFEDIHKLGIKSERLDNNVFAMRRSIHNFKTGNTRILFVSCVNLIRGLSLPMTSHLIFYHKLPVSELKEVLIQSAQQIGRKTPLKIIHLNSEIQL